MDPLKDAKILAGLVIAAVMDRMGNSEPSRYDAVLLGLAKDILFATGITEPDEQAAHVQKLIGIIRDTELDQEIIG